MPVLVRFLFTLLSCWILLCWGCQKQIPKIKDVPKHVNIPIPKEEATRVNPFIAFYSLMNNVPCSFILKQTQLHDFVDFFYSGRLMNWFNYDAISLDTAVQINVRLRPAYNFIKSFADNSYYRSHDYTSIPVLKLNAETNPDSLSRLSAPLLTPSGCLSLFHEKDSVYLFYSFQHYFELNLNQPKTILHHIFYNHHQKSFTLMTMDTLGNPLHSILLCTVLDSISNYTFYFPIASSVQVIKHTIKTLSCGLVKENEEEFKRIYIDKEGNLFDWTDAPISPDNFCHSLPKDSMFDTSNNYENRIVAAPLPLRFENKLKLYLIQHDYSILTSLYSITTSFLPLNLYYYESIMNIDKNRSLLVVSNEDQSFLVLLDSKNNIKDAINMSRTQVYFPEFQTAYTIGRLMPDEHVCLVNTSVKSDTLDEWKLKEDKFISLRHKPMLLTMPYGYLDDYFPTINENKFDLNNLSPSFSLEGNIKTFPDSIISCITEMSKLNGGSLYGMNYSIIHPSSGLTYLVLFHEGEAESNLNLMIIDKNNILQNGTFALASGGGDEGDYWSSKGYFINDSTYFQTTLSCTYEVSCDSTVTILRISSNGKLNFDESQSRHFILPYQ